MNIIKALKENLKSCEDFIPDAEAQINSPVAIGPTRRYLQEKLDFFKNAKESNYWF